MNGKQLKNSILQWAIQGKLVPQDASEEPAIELLKRLKTKVKPITDDVPFEVPKSWVWVKLRDVFTFINGDRGKNYPSKSKLSITGAIPFISAMNMENCTIKNDGLMYVDENLFNKLRSGKLQRNDFVLCIRGSLGKFCLYPYEIGAIASSLVILRKNLDIEDIFISTYLSSSLFLQEMQKYNNGTAQPNLGAKDVSAFCIPLPPLAEQKRIVEKIEELMPLVERYTKAQEGLDKLNAGIKGKLRASILQEAIRGKLVPQDANEEPAIELLKRINPKLQPTTEDVPFEVPESWVWCKMNDVISLLSGRDLEKDRYYSNKKGIPYIIGATNFENGHLLVNRWTDKPATISQMGDLLITCKGTIGKMAFNNIGDIHIARQVMAISSHYIDLRYIQAFLRCNIASLETQAKSMIPGISRDTILKAIIPIPPLAEQKRIVEKIEKLFIILDNIEKV